MCQKARGISISVNKMYDIRSFFKRDLNEKLWPLFSLLCAFKSVYVFQPSHFFSVPLSLSRTRKKKLLNLRFTTITENANKENVYTSIETPSSHRKSNKQGKTDRIPEMKNRSFTRKKNTRRKVGKATTV